MKKLTAIAIVAATLGLTGCGTSHVQTFAEWKVCALDVADDYLATDEGQRKLDTMSTDTLTDYLLAKGIEECGEPPK